MATLTRISASNFLRLKAVEIETNGKTTVVGGRNGQGKSSVLRIVECLLAGKKAAPNTPLRQGTKKGKIAIDVADCFDAGDLHFERSVGPKGLGQLKITGTEGAVLGGPQGLADKLRGGLMFDPMAFDRMARGTPEQQRKASATLRDLIGLDISTEQTALEQLQEERRDMGREAARLEAAAEKMPHYDDVPDREVSTSELAGQLVEAQAHNATNTERRRQRERCIGDGKRAAARVRELEQELVRARACLEDLRTESLRLAAEIDAAEELDTSAILEQLKAAGETNRKVSANDEKRDADDKAGAARAAYGNLTEAIDQAREAIATKTQAAKYPVEGLEVTDEGVELDGLPWDQACMSRRITASVAIGFTQHPELRLLLIEEGAYLDTEHLELVAKLAEEHGGMALVEVVSEENAHVVIEDGEVAQ